MIRRIVHLVLAVVLPLGMLIIVLGGAAQRVFCKHCTR